MDDQDLLRYSRHILLDEFGVEAQQKLKRSRALIVGAGGLGSPVALYLASAGIGHITVCDGDAVDLTNLQRQIAHRVARIGVNKAQSAATAMAEINPTIEVEVITQRLDAETLLQQVAQADVVLDCSDNFATRDVVNRACVAAMKPLVSGAAIRFDGQVSVFDMRDREAPCYACLFPADARGEDVACAVMGVFAPLTGIVGTIQAAEAIKVLTGIGSTLSGRLMMISTLDMRFHEVRVTRDPHCAVCATRKE